MRFPPSESCLSPLLVSICCEVAESTDLPSLWRSRGSGYLSSFPKEYKIFLQTKDYLLTVSKVLLLIGYFSYCIYFPIETKPLWVSDLPRDAPFRLSYCIETGFSFTCNTRFCWMWGPSGKLTLFHVKNLSFGMKTPGLTNHRLLDIEQVNELL